MQHLKLQTNDSKKIIAGNVVVHNAHLVSDKLLMIMEQILLLDDYKQEHGLYNIIFDRDGLPRSDDGKPYFAAYNQSARSITMNLEAIVTDVLEYTTGNGANTSMRTFYWHSMLFHFLHDLHHSWAFEVIRGDDEDITNCLENWDEEEKLASEWAKETLIKVAQTMDIQPPKVEKMPYLNECLIDVFSINIAEVNPERLEWLKHQQQMLKLNLIYHDTKSNTELLTMKEYFRYELDDGKDEGWGNDHLITFSASENAQVDTVVPPPETNTNIEVPPPPAAEIPWDTEPAVPLPPAPEDVAEEPQVEYQAYDEEPVFSDEMPLPGTDIPTGTPDATDIDDPVIIKPLNNNQLSTMEIMSICKTVYLRIHQHIFDKCGFSPIGGTGFNNAGAVVDGVDISDIQVNREDGTIIKASDIFIKMDCLDADGRWMPNSPVSTHIKGKVFKPSGLPGYELYLNINGLQCKRRLIPQNINKQSKPGEAARAGNQISWIIDALVDTDAFKAKIENATYIPIIKKRS